MPIEKGYYSKQADTFQTYYNSTRQAELIAASYPKCLKRLLKLPAVNKLYSLKKVLTTRACFLDLKDILDQHNPNLATEASEFIYHGVNCFWEQQPCVEIVLDFNILASVRQPKNLTRVVLPHSGDDSLFMRTGFTYAQICQRIHEQEIIISGQLKGGLTALDYILNLDLSLQAK